MSMQRTPMTRTGFERLRDELDRLKRVERPTIIKAIAEARAHGDLSENAEYHAAREKQSFIEGRINDLEGKVNGAEVIEPPKGGDRVTFGSTVRLEDEAGKEVRYWIVGSDEADPARGRISILSPLARTLIGKRVGDNVTARMPLRSKGSRLSSLARAITSGAARMNARSAAPVLMEYLRPAQAEGKVVDSALM